MDTTSTVEMPLNWSGVPVKWAVFLSYIHMSRVLACNYVHPPGSVLAWKQLSFPLYHLLLLLPLCQYPHLGSDFIIQFISQAPGHERNLRHFNIHTFSLVLHSAMHV